MKKRNLIRFVLPAFPVKPKQDKGVLGHYMDGVDRLWDALAQIDHDLYSAVPADHFKAMRLLNRVRDMDGSIANMKHSPQRRSLGKERAGLSDRLAGRLRRLDADPLKKEIELAIDRTRMQREVLDMCDLSPRHRDQVLRRYQERFTAWQRLSVPWGGEPLQQAHKRQTSLLYFPDGKTSLSAVLKGGLKGLWLQPALDGEIQEATWFLKNPLENPRLLEAKLGDDWSFPAVRLVVDLDPLYESPIDFDVPIYMAILGRAGRSFQLVLVLNAGELDDAEGDDDGQGSQLSDSGMVATP